MIYIICKNCNKEKEVRTKRKYCSLKCCIKYFKNNYSRSLSDKETTKQFIWACQDCGYKQLKKINPFKEAEKLKEIVCKRCGYKNSEE